MPGHEEGGRAMSAEPFVKLPVALLAQRDLPLGAKVLLAVISNRVGANGHAWPGIRRLADDLATDCKAILRWLDRLEDSRLLIVNRHGSGKGNTYRLPSDGDTPALANNQRSLFTNAGAGKSPTEALVESQRKRRRTIQKNQRRSGLKAVRPADGLWIAVCELFSLKPETKADRSRVGRVVSDLTAKGATCDELKIRVERYRAEWSNVECTPEALLKHWDRFGAAGAPRTGTAGGVARIGAPAGKYARVAKKLEPETGLPR